MNRDAATTPDDLATEVGWDGVGVRGVDWACVERRLAVSLPASYMEYVEKFPPGVFQTFLKVVQPDSPANVEQFIDDVNQEAGFLQSMVSESVGFPYPMYPAVPGLFPWGHIGTDFSFCWLLDRTHNANAPTVLVATFDGSTQLLDGSMVDCILSVIRGQVPLLRYVAEQFDPPRFEVIPTELP